MAWELWLNRYPPAKLALANGSVFNGYAIGASGTSLGEVVFNTSMTGYQEIITDPSYAQQIVTFTTPHVGNVGVNPDDEESPRIRVAGLVMRDFSHMVSNWRSVEGLDIYLKRQKVIAIAGVDTRRLTRLLRDYGAQNGCITTDTALTDACAIEQALTFPGLAGLDLAQKVSLPKPMDWIRRPLTPRFHVIVYDFGVKAQTLHLLVEQGCRITLVPATTPAIDVLALRPHGVLLSNGPGDPAACGYAMVQVRELLNHDIPVFGICLGFQLLALALGLKTKKMKFGHHGANHPVQDVRTGVVYITSQNHGFTVDEEDEALWPADLYVTHRSLFDGTLQGFSHTKKPIIAFQGHPEASPGPHDIRVLFNRFLEAMQQRVS